MSKYGPKGKTGAQHRAQAGGMMEKMGRLAMRREGKWWNAYYAVPDTMEGAIQLGSIAMAFVQGGELQVKRKEAFMDFMRECVGDILEEKFGVRPSWPDGPQSAPESERSGTA
jgi:hypothetical protein